MDPNSKRQKRRDNALSLLNVAIEAVNLAKELSSVTPAKAVFSSVSVLLAMIRDSMANRDDYVKLGLACADVCRALDRGMNGRRVNELSQSVFEAIAQLTAAVAEIQRDIVKRDQRNAVSRLFHAKDDQDAIAAWKSDLDRILHVFNTELAVNTHVIVSDVRRDVSRINHNVLRIREEIGGHVHSIQISTLKGLPPPQPRACFGRDELIDKIIGFAENLTPIALIGPGGIGKTSIALTVLHHDRIMKRFGVNRWFIRCDQFPTSRPHFLNQLSKVIGAGVENPEDLTQLQPFLSSREMIIFLDNVESVLGPRGKNAQEIYAVTEELSLFSNVCLCITSRISTIPPACESFDIPTLSAQAARDAFYRIYRNGRQSDLVNDILKQLDFHPLSITLLATVAHHNKWSTDRLSKEWKKQRTGVLRTQHDNSLSTTVELSLASPMFRELGPDARELLGVVAFFPQGIDENNLDWLFPTLSNRRKVFDNFCILSLVYQCNGFITMLAPLRDYLCLKDPASSPLLGATKDHYFSRLSVDVDPVTPGFEDARWITLEDANVEHLLDVFTSIDANSVDVWDACGHFMEHLCWHKKRLVVLGPKVEGLPDDHRSKPRCLFQLSRLFESVGNHVECKRLLDQTLKLWRERKDDLQVAQTLRFMSDANRWLGNYEEGIQQAIEALEIYEQFNDTLGQAHSWLHLARLLYGDKQFDAAEEAALRAIDLLSDKDEQFSICSCHRLLGDICRSKGKTDGAINHYETALRIASPSDWHDHLFWNNHSLAELSFDENRFDDADAHVERAKLHTIDNPYLLGRAMELQASFWYKEYRLEEAKGEVLSAVGVYEGIGATMDAERCRAILQNIEDCSR